MKINREALIVALKAVMPGLAQKEVIEQSTSFVFTEDGQVVTYNDEIAVSHPIKVNFTGAIPAKEFFGIINKVKADEIEITVTDGTLLVKGSRAKVGLRLDGTINLPIKTLAQPDKGDWTALPKLFCDALSFCMFSVSRDINKPVINCLHVFGQFVESTDNQRATRFDMGKKAKEAFPDSILIPSYAVRAIVGYTPTSYAVTEGWVHFKNEAGLQFSCRVFEEEYPDVAPLLKMSGSPIKFPATLSDLLDKATVFNENSTITLEKNKLTVSSEGDSGWFSEAARAEYDGETFSFDIAPEFMKSIRKITDTAEVKGNLMKFKGENFEHVLALLKPKAKGGKK